MRTIYPRVMPWETADARGGRDPQGAATALGGESREPPAEEHLGPLAFTREVKDDGRALILYRRSGGRADG
jgi:hypothetical protein